MKNSKNISILTSEVSKYKFDESSNAIIENFEDSIIIEEALEIKIEFGKKYNRKEESIALTMRTAGNDEDLVIGFLFCEGVISKFEDVKSIETNAVDQNKVTLKLQESVLFDLEKLSRHIFTSSSCGVCGKEKISNLFISKNNTAIKNKAASKINAALILKIYDALNQHKSLFNITGGNHTSYLFNSEAKLIDFQEDVGRHNALDKLIGHAFKKNKIPLTNQFIVLSGRISFELVQKAVLAGCNLLIALGAPSSLAIKVAKENNLCLIGFLKKDSFNIYSLNERIIANQ